MGHLRGHYCLLSGAGWVMSGNMGMLTLALVLVAFLGGMVFLTVLPKKPATGPKEAKKTTTTKLVVWFCLGNGVAWVWCSYILAYLGREEIAESLSKVAITEIIGVVLAYCLKSLAENLSRNNQWPDKPAATKKNPRRDAD